MTYNIHPIIVHFPVALLFLYSIVKIIPFRRWFPNVAWRHVQVVLLCAGVVGAVAALITGPIAKGLIHPNEELVTFHASFAITTFLIFGSLLIGEIISIKKSTPNILSEGKISKIIALLGLISITITGMLGGVMVYGLSADPMAGFVIKLLGIEL